LIIAIPSLGTGQGSFVTLVIFETFVILPLSHHARFDRGSTDARACRTVPNITKVSKITKVTKLSYQTPNQ
jgi:hypothetical protein